LCNWSGNRNVTRFSCLFGIFMRASFAHIKSKVLFLTAGCCHAKIL
jgi:hypothetical protein